MKRIIFAVLFSILVVAGVALSDYFPDVIVTSPSGIWTDTRAYTTIDDAISAIGANDRDIYIAREETTTTLTIPANASLHFFNTGSIANSGQLTINTTNIRAPNRQIFTGAGNIDFADGTIVKSGWFSNVESAFALTVNDTVTLIISKAQTITGSFSPGDDVNLRWDSPGNILTINAGVVVGNLRKIEAGNYQIFAGAGDFDFLDGTHLKLDWFNRLRSVVTWVENEEVTLVVSGTNIVDLTETVDANITLDMDSERGLFSDNGGAIDLTIKGAFIACPRQVFDWTGSGSVNLSSAQIEHSYAEWWDIDGTADEVQINLAITAFPKVKLLGTTYVLAASITPPSNSELFGDIEKTIIDNSNVNDEGIYIDSKSNIYIHDLRILGSNNVAHTSNIGIKAQATTAAVTDVIIERVVSYSAGRNGISFGANATYENLRNVIRNCTTYSNQLNGIYYSGSHSKIIRNISYSNCVSETDGYGIYVDDAYAQVGIHGMLVSENTIYSNLGGGIGLAGVSNSLVSNNLVYSNGKSTVAGRYQSHGIILLRAWNNPYLSTCNGTNVEGNIVQRSYRAGIMIDGVDGFSVTDNLLEDNSYNNTGTFAGVSLRSYSSTKQTDNGLIANNRFVKISGSSYQDYGIEFVDDSAVTYPRGMLIDANIHSGNTSGPYALSSYDTTSIVERWKFDGGSVILTLATDVVTLDGRDFYTVAAETGTADDLATINGGTYGKRVIISPDSGDTITAKDGTGNLRLNGDFAMNSTNDQLVLLWNGNLWLELSRSDNA